MDLKALKKKLKAELKDLRKERRKAEKEDEGHTDTHAQICFLVEKADNLAYLDGKIDTLKAIRELL